MQTAFKFCKTGIQMSEIKKYSAKRIFTGHSWLSNHTLIIQDGIIAEIIPTSSEENNITEIIAPAFIDIQIYGAFGKLLSVYPDTDALQKLYTYCIAGGASHFQPTVATNDTAIFFKAIDAVRDYWKEGGKGCIGLHIEGPWIHTAKKGAHLEAYIHVPKLTEVKQLLEYGKGVISMITLAPEICSVAVLELILSYGVIISAGHSNASYEEATGAFNEGINTVTHLYNAMSALQHRAPGMVGAVFLHPTVLASIVPDGYHVDFAAIKIAKQIMGDRLFAITDAVTETSNGAYPHHLSGDKYESNGILSGSALDMALCLRNLVNHVQISLEEALRMVSLYPAGAMHLSNRLGIIEKGKEANLVLLNADLQVSQVISFE